MARISKRLKDLEEFLSSRPAPTMSVHIRLEIAARRDKKTCDLLLAWNRLTESLGLPRDPFAVALAIDNHPPLLALTDQLDAAVAEFETKAYGQPIEDDPQTLVELYRRVKLQVQEGIWGGL